MKTPIALLSMLLVPALLLAAQDPAGAPAPTGEPETSELAEHMEHIEVLVGKLRRSLRKPEQKADSLGHVAEMQAATLASKGLVPAMATRLPEAERPAFVTAYRIDMVAMLSALLELELALLEDRHEEANAIFKRVRAMEDSGHERFTAE